MSLDFLPTELEQIIFDYKKQIENHEKVLTYIAQNTLSVKYDLKTFSITQTNSKTLDQKTYSLLAKKHNNDFKNNKRVAVTYISDKNIKKIIDAYFDSDIIVENIPYHQYNKNDFFYLRNIDKLLLSDKNKRPF